MYKINEVAQQFSINANVLRFYEKKGLIQPIRDSNGYRSYSIDDIAKIQTILLLRNMGFTIISISELLNQNHEPVDLFIQQYDILNRHIHSMKFIRSSIEDCIDELFKKSVYSDEIIGIMKETAKVLSKMNSWQDKWSFDAWAARYDEEIRIAHKGLDFYKNYDSVLLKTAAFVNQHNGLTIDVGIGTGTLAGMLMAGNQVIGVDQSINMIKECKRKYPKLKVCIGTFLQLPLEHGIADNIVTTYAFHHCNDDEKILAIKEMDRVLKNNGHIIISDLMFENQEKKDDFLKYCSSEEYSDVQDEYFALVDQLEKIFNELGYHCEKEQVDNLMWIVCAHK